ncbi:MAG: hypothetical protein V1664_04755 [Candidatus Uhrbacteria bacterium]
MSIEELKYNDLTQKIWIKKPCHSERHGGICHVLYYFHKARFFTRLRWATDGQARVQNDKNKNPKNP